MFVARLDRIGIAHGAAGLDDGRDAGAGGLIYIITEGEERIGSEYAALASLASLAHGHVDRIDAAHLPGADTDDHAALAQHNGVAFDVFAHQPGEMQIAHFLLGRCAFCHDLELPEIVAASIARLYEQTAVDAAIIESYLALAAGIERAGA